MAGTTKVCTKCGAEKPAIDFGRRKASADGRQSWCQSCMRDAYRKWRAEHPDRVQAYKAKAKEVEHERYQEDPAYRFGKIQAAAKHRRRLPAEKKRAADRKQLLKREYGLSAEDYSSLLRQQGGVCAICAKPETATQRGVVTPLAVDHDHATGKVRGVLCRACNAGLGALGDSVEGLQRAIAYLKRDEPRLYEPFTFVG